MVRWERADGEGEGGGGRWGCEDDMAREGRRLGGEGWAVMTGVGEKEVGDVKEVAREAKGGMMKKMAEVRKREVGQSEQRVR